MPGPYDPSSWLRAQSPDRPNLSFEKLKSRDPKAVVEWQSQARDLFEARLGFPKSKPCALNARAVADPVIVDDTYRREEIAFDSREGLPVFGYFLTPLAGCGPFPLMLCHHGHGYGVNAVVGLDASGEPLKEDEYHHAFAVQAVKRGYAVLAIEILGFGRRAIGNDCAVLSGAALMLGQTLAAWRVYDSMRAADYALTRPEVDASRIAAMGISGGGLNVLFFAALDRRIAAAVVSGYVNEFTASVMSISHCIDNFMPALRLDLEMSDIAAIIAPRPLWCENGDADTIFPVAAFRRAIDKITNAYAALGAADRVYGHVFKGEHQFNGEGCWEFLDRYLG